MCPLSLQRSTTNNGILQECVLSHYKEVPPIMAWQVEAALRKMKNWKEPGKDQVNIETLRAGYETIAKQLAKLYTKCIKNDASLKHGRKQKL